MPVGHSTACARSVAVRAEVSGSIPMPVLAATSEQAGAGVNVGGVAAKAHLRNVAHLQSARVTHAIADHNRASASFHRFVESEHNATADDARGVVYRRAAKQLRRCGVNNAHGGKAEQCCVGYSGCLIAQTI